MANFGLQLMVCETHPEVTIFGSKLKVPFPHTHLFSTFWKMYVIANHDFGCIQPRIGVWIQKLQYPLASSFIHISLGMWSFSNYIQQWLFNGREILFQSQHDRWYALEAFIWQSMIPGWTTRCKFQPEVRPHKSWNFHTD